MEGVFEGLATIALTPVFMVIGHGTTDRLMDFKCIEKCDRLEISGWTGGSGDYISTVTTRRKGTDLFVTVHWVLAGVPHPLCPERKCLKALHDYPIALDSSIERVFLGKEGNLIWQRARAYDFSP